jgi:hypothetical protein
MPHPKQRGISLIQVAIVMASLAAIAMAGLMSMRHERNYFTETLGRLTGKASVRASANASGAADKATAAAPALPSAPAGVLRKCVIDGKTVLSDVACAASNPSSQVVRVRETRGIESPKAPKPEPAESGPQSAQDKMIEKATR